MAYKAVERVNVRCPHHTRFHPERDGVGAIKGNCPWCWALCEIYAALRKARVLASSKELGKPAK